MACSTVQIVPGAQGAPGANGTDGNDGQPAYTLADAFTMPAEGSPVDVVVENSDWMAVGEVIWARGGGSQGNLSVTAITDSTHVTLTNLANSGTGAYADNSAPGSAFPPLTQIVASGFQGPAGSVPGGVMLRANNLSDVNDVVAAGVNLGLGGAAYRDVGAGLNNLPPWQTVVNVGDIVFATAAGIRTHTDVETRAYLSLGTIYSFNYGIANTNVPYVDQLAGLTNGQAIFATAAGIQSLTAASARSALGIATGAGDMLLFWQQANSGTGGGAFVSLPGVWQTIPLTTEVVDTGNHGSIAANQFTLDAGTYRYRFVVFATSVHAAAKMQGRIYNFSDSAVQTMSGSATGCYGLTAYNNSDGSMISSGSGRFTLASGKTLRLEAQLAGGDGTFGVDAGFGSINVFSFIELLME